MTNITRIADDIDGAAHAIRRAIVQAADLQAGVFVGVFADPSNEAGVPTVITVQHTPEGAQVFALAGALQSAAVKVLVGNDDYLREALGLTPDTT